MLRGGGGRVNYDAVSIALAERQLAQANLPTNIVVDCSHGNSNKDPSVQPLVAENCVTQILDGNRSIVGLMLESHLKAGNQPIPKDLSTLEYGVSITDPCMDWQSTETLLLKLHAALQNRPAVSAGWRERDPLGPIRGRNTRASRAAARRRVAVDQHRAIGAREMREIRSAVAVGGDAARADSPRAAARGSALSPRRADWRVRKAPSSRSPSQRTSVHSVRSKPNTRPMRGTYEIRARGEQHQMIARRAVRLERCERCRAELAARLETRTNAPPRPRSRRAHRRPSRRGSRAISTAAIASADAHTRCTADASRQSRASRAGWRAR